MSTAATNPALEASKLAMQRLKAYLDNGESFVFEAGAGAGKTYSLIESLNVILDERKRQLEQNDQKIACITYTNVAKDEIIDRTGQNPLIFASTIHGFCWDLIKPFQGELRRVITSIGKWEKRVEEKEVEIRRQRVGYDELGYPSIDENVIQLHHNDVLELFSKFLNNKKFWKIFADKFPIVFIDEYQDTDKSLAEAIIRARKENSQGPLIGFFGDHWQKIYKEGLGRIPMEGFQSVEKGANFRSVNTIVQFLNRMRPELPQEPEDPGSTGFLKIYHTNGWEGERRTGGHWGGDLPIDTANTALEETKKLLVSQGWDLSPKETKILMLTHNVLASRQGYQNIAGLFSSKKEAFTKKEHPYIKFLCEVVEPFIRCFEKKNYGEMFSVSGIRRPRIESISDKRIWIDFLETLKDLRNKGSIGEVLAHLRSFPKFNLPESILKKEKQLSVIEDSESEVELTARDQRTQNLKEVPYQEIISLYDFLEDNTPFSTQHGVKGAQFENVLVVMGRGWNLYNFDKFLSWCQTGKPTEGKELKTFERNRNLFYVACSRPKTRLALLFTQLLSPEALTTLERWSEGQVEELILN